MAYNMCEEKINPLLIFFCSFLGDILLEPEFNYLPGSNEPDKIGIIFTS